MKSKTLSLLVLLCAASAACDKPSLLPIAATPAAAPPISATAAATAATPAMVSDAAPMTPVPDVGRVKSTTVTASGSGPTAAEAVDDAIRMAVLQANGVSIDLNSARYRLAVNVAVGQDAAAIRANGFAQRVIEKAGGTISSFKVIELIEPDTGLLARTSKQPPVYKATIEASMPRFEAPADTGKLKIVIGPIRTGAASYLIGGQRVSAEKLAQDIREQVLSALSNTGRFTILDREFDDQIRQELEMIADGQTPRGDTARLGQALSADLIWTGNIQSFSYDAQVRQLETSNRSLVSYSGAWAMSQRVLNVATRQVMLAETLQGQPPSTAPTTLSTGVDGTRIARTMQSELIDRAVASIVLKTFPISVASRDGLNVILSQGGRSVKEGARYQMVALGQQIKDPQTGQSLGRTETPCCQVIVDKVTPTMSYGHLENVTMTLDDIPAGGLQVRDVLGGPRTTLAAAPGSVSAGGSASGRTRVPASPKPAAAIESALKHGPPAAAADAKW